MPTLSIALIYDQSADSSRIDVNAIVDSVEAIGAALQGAGHRTAAVCVSDGIAPFVEKLTALGPDVVFNLCEGYRGDSAAEPGVASLLELLHLPYTGSGPVTLAMALNKPLCKRLLAGAGIPTPEFTLHTPDARGPRPRTYPAMLKLAAEDASLGITADNVVAGDEAFDDRLQALFDEFQAPVMAERFVDGREFTVAMHDGEPLVLEEIEFMVEPRIVCYAAKWVPGSEEYAGTRAQFAPIVSDGPRKQMLELAREVYHLLGMRDYARVDFRLDRDDRPFVLEANPNPDITPGSGYCRALEAAGLSYSDFLDRMVRRAFDRGRPRVGAAERNVSR